MWWRKHDNIFSRFDTVPACDGRTDGRTDRQTDAKPIAITCFSIADARKNASASGGLRPPDLLLGLCPWTPLGDFRPPDPWLPPIQPSGSALASQRGKRYWSSSADYEHTVQLLTTVKPSQPAYTSVMFTRYSVKLEGSHRVRTHAVLLLTLAITLTFVLWPFNLRTIYFLAHPKVIPYTKFEHFGIIRYWVMLPTNRQTNRLTRTFYPRRPILSACVIKEAWCSVILASAKLIFTSNNNNTYCIFIFLYFILIFLLLFSVYYTTTLMS